MPSWIDKLFCLRIWNSQVKVKVSSSSAKSTEAKFTERSKFRFYFKDFRDFKEMLCYMFSQTHRLAWITWNVLSCFVVIWNFISFFFKVLLLMFKFKGDNCNKKLANLSFLKTLDFMQPSKFGSHSKKTMFFVNHIFYTYLDIQIILVFLVQ